MDQKEAELAYGIASRLPAITLRDLRWFPAAEELRSTAYEKLLPPLVAKVREDLSACLWLCTDAHSI